jgi:outer membrane protein OmpA-like peptidoglycan-associated protein/tetratricopeptide (TPR) repeat protein
MKNLKWICLSAYLMTSGLTYSQAIKMKIANSEFENMRYSDAIIHYKQILLKDTANLEAKTKLAECYRKTEDHKNELEIYSELVHTENVAPKTYWYYAQALAANGQYKESIPWYEKYQQNMPNDLYGDLFAKAYQDMNKFFKDSSYYHIQYVPSINSWQSDFSPAFYRGGLIFLSNRKQQQIIRRVYELDQTSFLDYYYYPDTSVIYSELQRPVATYAVNREDHSHSDYTIHTSNDNHTIGAYGDIYRYDSVKYQNENPDGVIRFSKTANNKYHEGPVTFTRNQDTVYFTRNVPKSRIKGQKAISHFALFSAVIKNGEWVHKREVPFNGKNFSTGHPAFSPDFKKMYFASDRPEGKGGVDIYVVDVNQGTFSEPVNVEEINTPDDEMFPYMDESGDLYFSTEGFPGLGGLDLFRAKMKEGEVVSVKNMGIPFNSNHDDFGIIWNKDMSKGFFSSNRKRSSTDDDIYSIEKLCRTTTAYVYDSITYQPIDSALVEVEGLRGYTDNLGQVEFCLKARAHSYSVGKTKYERNQSTSWQLRTEIPLRHLKFNIAGRISSPEDHEAIGGVKIILTNLENGNTSEWITAEDGKYHFDLNVNSNYSIAISKKLCGTNSVDITTKGLTKSQTLKGDMEMLCQGDIVKIDNIYYDLNKSDIRSDAALELDKMVALMNQYPDMRIELRSHTDSRASDVFNMRLSANRAQAVVEYMANHGVVPFRMRAAGYGETLPVNGCVNGVRCTEEEYQLNRRTEFKVLAIK